VARAVQGEPKVAVAFSGGLDSSVLVKCAAKRTQVVACAGYSRGSTDSARVMDSAASLGAELAAVELTPGMVKNALVDLDLGFVPTLMDRSLWVLYRLVAKEASRSGARVMLLGQLADELFGGYAKYSAAMKAKGDEEAALMMRADVADYARRGRLRDVAACSSIIEPRFPFEAAEIVEFALGLPLPFKIRQGERKAVLRRAAAILGVPKEQAEAPKKAAQYSSGVQKLVADSDF
jgi:asparagine synthase (glutamine-hydrolysing)